jgi:hypothetical protein
LFHINIVTGHLLTLFFCLGKVFCVFLFSGQSPLLALFIVGLFNALRLFHRTSAFQERMRFFA